MSDENDSRPDRRGARSFEDVKASRLEALEAEHRALRKAAKKIKRQKAKEAARERARQIAGEGDFALDVDTVATVLVALVTRNRDRLLKTVEGVHHADLADLIEQIGSHDRSRLIKMLGSDVDPEMLSDLDEATRDEVLGYMRPEDIAEAVSELETDDVVYLVEDLEPEAQSEILDNLEAADRAAIEQSLAYPEDSAGRLMQREMVWAPPFRTVGEMIDWMRSTDDLPEQFYNIVIVDPVMQPIGQVALSRVMGAGRHVTLEELKDADLTIFRVDQSQEDVGYAFNQYHIVSAPVVDETGRLAGVITIDDAIQALDEEAEEDLLRLGGVGDESLGDAVLKIIGRRFPWLAVNLVTAILASLVIGLFDGAIEQIVALAILMPIVASMGGNAGTQTLTVAVRALATKDLTRTNAMRIIAREAAVGLANGLSFAVIVGAVGWIWFDSAMLGVVLALAMVVNMLIAGLAGILIPIGLDTAGADPALASGVFVTTVTDVVGFFAFLGIAVVLLL
ncbi:MAG: magnesium transporter [Pseudomonadota bacterium]